MVPSDLKRHPIRKEDAAPAKDEKDRKDEKSAPRPSPQQPPSATGIVPPEDEFVLVKNSLRTTGAAAAASLARPALKK